MARSWLDTAQKRPFSDYYNFREKRPRFLRNGPSRSRHLLPITGIIALVIIFVTFNGHKATSNATTYLKHTIADSANTTTSKELIASEYAGRIKHVLSPADKGNADTCKLILSAAVNDYELVTFYNFHKTGNKLAKISGGLDYMNRLDPSRDEELLLIVDGFDEWFQLPASIMEDRYHEINRRENERILTRTGKSYKQSIIISTQRQCWPGNSADVSCYAAPESPLPAYIFGPETDNMVDEWNRYAKLRPRYMNAGYTIGPVKDMRRLWTRAQEYADENPKVVGLDQNILARIWGEQNYVRELARFKNEPLQTERPDYSKVAEINRKNSRNDLKGRIAKRDLGFPQDKSNPTRKHFTPKNDTDYEFGIGLDYGSELSLPTVFAEYDADWLTFSNATNLAAAFEAQNVTHPGATRLQDDIAALPAERAPFAALRQMSPATAVAAGHGSSSVWDSEEDEQVKALRQIARVTTWRDIPLFTNMWTGITPAIVHHNAWRDGLKDRRRSTWEQMWYQPYARQLLDAWAHSPPPPSSAKKESKWRLGRGRVSAKFRRFLGGGAEAVKAEGGRTRELGAHTDNDKEGNWVNWKDLCGETQQQEVFRDHKGVWIGPGGAERKGGQHEDEKKVKEKPQIVHNEPVR